MNVSSPLRNLIVVGFAFFMVAYPTQAQTRAEVSCDPMALVTAITDANSTPEADTLDLAVGCIYKFNDASDVDATIGDTALPRITSPLTINGNGAAIERESNLSFRLLFVTSSGNLTLNNLIVRKGNSTHNGGGIANEGTLAVNNSSISGNTTSGPGGGINNNGGTVILNNSTLSGNSANFDIGGGGGISNVGSGTVTVINSTISGNATTGSGGGIYNENSTLTVTNGTLSGNSANIIGGGAYNSSTGTLTMTNIIVSGNSAGANGGGIWNNDVLTVVNGVISGNSAGNFGGGIFNNDTATVINTTVSGNNAEVVGGIYRFAGTLTVTNSIVWGNNIQMGGVATVTYSIVQSGGYAGEGNLNLNPLFVNPVSYTSAPTSAGDYHLRLGSPAIDAGSDDELPADTQDLDGDSDTAETIPYDLDTSARIKDGGVDMGAYEWLTGIELLYNQGFELDGNGDKIPDGWTVKNATSDKLKCDPAKAHVGTCAFMFKGGAGENAKLTHKVDLTSATLGQGDTLKLSAYFNGSSPALNAKLALSVTYAGNPDAVKWNVSIVPNAAYAQIAIPDVNIGAGLVEKIKVTVKHKSTSGKLYIDTASLTLSRTSVRSQLLPPPPAPDGMRGFN